MASRGNVKQQRKPERPRSTATNVADKEKSNIRLRRPDVDRGNTGPSSEVLPEEFDDNKSVIINEEIRSLQIKEADLQKLRETVQPQLLSRKATPVFTTVLVKKPIPPEMASGKCVVVARPAPIDAPAVMPDYSKLAGPRFDETGNIIPHSILGNVDDFMTQAVRNGDISSGTPLQTSRSAGSLTVGAKLRKVRKYWPQYESAHESKALKNWDSNMKERRRQQNYLSKLLNKPVDQLVMNQSENYRKIQELRYLIDRTLPFVEKGKGHARGAEFWTLPITYGGELDGIQTTLTETEKGYPPCVEHISVPKTVLNEKGLYIEPTEATFRKPWHKSQFLCDRVLQLAPLMDELDPHEPDTVELEVVGNSKPAAIKRDTLNVEGDGHGAGDSVVNGTPDLLQDHPDVYPAAVFGPSIRFGGFRAQWAGDNVNRSGEVAIEARVSFESCAGDRTMSFLDISNDGTAAIYFSWKKVSNPNPFDVNCIPVQRFYFNQSNGVILPGDCTRFPFVFKSSNAGVFTEQWEFQTHPVLCGGAKLMVNLRGVSVKPDTNAPCRMELEETLSDRQVRQIVECIVQDLVASVQTPERPRSPIDAYITDEELFSRINPELYYTRDKFDELNALYVELLPEEGKHCLWDLSVSSVRQAVLALSDEDDRKPEMLQRLNGIITAMSFKPLVPNNATLYNAGYSFLSEAVDNFVQNDSVLRLSLGVPDKRNEPIAPAAPSSTAPATFSTVRGVTSLRPDSAETSFLDTTVESKQKGASTKGKEKKTSSKDGKQSPSRKEAASTTGGPGRSRTSIQASAAVERSVSQTTASQAASGTDVIAAASSGQPAVPLDNPATLENYRNKLYLQTYQQLCTLAEDMELVLGELYVRNQGVETSALTLT